MKRAAIGALALACLFAKDARAEGELPPWTDASDVPLPAWARSIAPKRADAAIYAEPGNLAVRRGSALVDTRLPLFGKKSAAGCTGAWLNVGPIAWMCSDAAEISADEPLAVMPALATHADGLPYRYFFVGRDGANAFTDPARAEEDPPDAQLDPGWAVAVVEERAEHGERWGRTNHGKWIALRELGEVRATAFHGELITSDRVDVAWVMPERAQVYTSPKQDRAASTRVHWQTVRVYEEKATSAGAMVRVSAEGASPAEWMRAKDLARHTMAPPPDEIAAIDPASPAAKWIDVELASQTLVAYEGARPVYAALVSTGRGAQGTETATRVGTHRIWVKLTSTTMDNLEREDTDEHYSIEDVPYVQFFDKGIALHGAFWHHDFGHVHSHGCVNLAPLDAAWLFSWTAPHLPRGWSAVLPDAYEEGSLVRVR